METLNGMITEGDYETKKSTKNHTDASTDVMVYQLIS